MEVRGRHLPDRRGDRAGAAVDWILELGIERIRAHEEILVADALTRLAAVPGITLHGPPDAADRGSLVSFALEGAHPHDIGEILGREGICVRAGHHCAQPLMRRLGVGATPGRHSRCTTRGPTWTA